MSKTVVRFLTIALVAALLTAAAPSALAEDFTADASFSMTAGDGAKFYTVAAVTGGTALTLESSSGSLFSAGMTAMVTTTGVEFYGTITEPGTYTGTITASWTTESGVTRYTYNITMAVAAPPTPTPSPTPEPTPSPSPSPTPAPTPTPGPMITKDPTKETVQVGGSATFIAHADNATERAWRFVSANGQKTVYYTSAATYFPGLQVSGGNTDTLVLSSIPLALNGWKAACMFKGPGGEVLSGGAIITVLEKAAEPPVITQQPSGAKLAFGETVSLSVRATATDGGSLSYQWYSGSSNSLAAVRAIDGAVSASYRPPEQAGTVYYCVGVCNNNNGEKSDVVYSGLAAVTYGEPEPSPTPSPTPSPEPTHEHSFSTAWSSNLDSHWRSCACGARGDEGAHEFEWTEVKPATKKEEGLRTGVCGVCGYAVEQTIPTSGLQHSQLGTGRTLLLILLGVAALAIIAAGVLVILKVTGRLGQPRGRRR